MATAGSAACRLLLRDQCVEAFVGIGAGLVHCLLLQDQVLHGLTDEVASKNRSKSTLRRIVAVIDQMKVAGKF